MAKQTGIKAKKPVLPAKEEFLKPHFPWKIWWDPIPDWPGTFNPDQWIRFRELELDLRKKQLEVEQQFITGLKNIVKRSK